MPSMKICAHQECQQPFMAFQRKRKYCSRRCAQQQKKHQSDDVVRHYITQRIALPSDPHACWPWTGVIDRAGSGYGIAYVRGQRLQAHRLVYEIFAGPVPPDMNILHSLECAMRRCVNPQHLRIGTQQENIQDTVLSGHVPQGESHHAAKLDVRAVRHIRLLYTQGMAMIDIASLYHISRITVHDVIYARCWKHVDAATYVPPHKQKHISKKQRDKVALVRALAQQDVAFAEIARTVGLGVQQIGNIVSRKAFRDLP